MSESEPSSHVDPTYGFSKTLKLGPSDERILSLDRHGDEHTRRVLAWSVRWVLSVRRDGSVKRLRVERTVLANTTRMGKESYVIYRRLMLELLRRQKPVFDQLAIELPCLMGFRPEEVGTWRAEYIDFVNGDTQVLDAKKHRLFAVPLNTQVAKHAEEVLGPRSNGLVLQSRSNRQQDPEKPLSTVAVWYIWQKWTQHVGAAAPISVSPVVGRRFFAAEWYYSQGLSLVTLQRILRHSHFETTVRYVQSLVFHEDVKRDYDRFQLGLMQPEVITK